MSKPEKLVKLQVAISKCADELLRAQLRHKGDLGHIIDALIIEKFAPKVSAPPVEQTTSSADSTVGSAAPV